MTHYTSQNGFYGSIDANGKFNPNGHDVTVTSLKTVYEDNTAHITVKFYAGDKLQSIDSPVQDIIRALGQTGYPVSNAQSNSLLSYINQQISTLHAESVHENIGWHYNENTKKLVFKGQEMIGGKSTYIGNYNIAPRGNIEDFRAEYGSLILGNPPLELSMVIGLSSCLTGYLSVMSKGIEIPSLLFDINGRSTTGKSTCGKFAVSMGGFPDKIPGKMSLAGTCSTTVNALYGILNDNYGYTMLFDEIARLGKYADFTSMIYSLSDGTDKNRLGKSSKVIPPRTWATSIVFTGEFSLLKYAAKADGLQMRVISFPNVQWTQSAEQAHAVSAFSKKYAGLPVMEFARYLYKLDPNAVLAEYEQKISSLTNEIPIKPCYKERMAKSVAMLMMTSELSAKAFDVTFSHDKIKSLVLENIAMSNKESEARIAYDFVLNQCEINASKFPKFSSDPDDLTKRLYDCWGSIQNRQIHSDMENKKVVTDLLIIREPIFKRWLKDGDFSEDNVLSEWKKNGVLYSTKPDHYYNVVSVQKGRPKTKCIRIVLNNEAYGETKLLETNVKFSERLFIYFIEKCYKEYAGGYCVEKEMADAVRKSIDMMYEGSMDTRLQAEIIQHCFKMSVDFPLIQSYLFGAEHKKWQEKNKAEFEKYVANYEPEAREGEYEQIKMKGMEPPSEDDLDDRL